jgi:hypothetical protein
VLKSASRTLDSSYLRCQRCLPSATSCGSMAASSRG